MKKSYDYHDPREKNVIIRAMAECHMNHHYRKIQNVLPCVDTNIRKSNNNYSLSPRCQCGNRIISNCVKKSLKQNEYKRNVDLGITCKKYYKCLDSSSNTNQKSSNTSFGESKLRNLTDVYHPPRPRSILSQTKSLDDDHSNWDWESAQDKSNLLHSRHVKSDYIELQKQITDDILNNSLYTSFQLKQLFSKYLNSDKYCLNQDEKKHGIINLEHELGFYNDLRPSTRSHYRISPSYNISPKLRLEDLNIDSKTLEDIRASLNLPNSSKNVEHDPSVDNKDDEISIDAIIEDDHSDIESDQSYNEAVSETDRALEEHILLDEDSNHSSGHHSDLPSKNHSESLEDLSSIHSLND